MCSDFGDGGTGVRPGPLPGHTRAPEPDLHRDPKGKPLPGGTKNAGLLGGGSILGRSEPIKPSEPGWLHDRAEWWVLDSSDRSTVGGAFAWSRQSNGPWSPAGQALGHGGRRGRPARPMTATAMRWASAIERQSSYSVSLWPATGAALRLLAGMKWERAVRGRCGRLGVVDPPQINSRHPKGARVSRFRAPRGVELGIPLPRLEVPAGERAEETRSTAWIELTDMARPPRPGVDGRSGNPLIRCDAAGRLGPWAGWLTHRRLRDSSPDSSSGVVVHLRRRRQQQRVQQGREITTTASAPAAPASSARHCITTQGYSGLSRHPAAFNQHWPTSQPAVRIDGVAWYTILETTQGCVSAFRSTSTRHPQSGRVTWSFSPRGSTCLSMQTLVYRNGPITARSCRALRWRE